MRMADDYRAVNKAVLRGLGGVVIGCLSERMASPMLDQISLQRMYDIGPNARWGQNNEPKHQPQGPPKERKKRAVPFASRSIKMLTSLAWSGLV